LCTYDQKELNRNKEPENTNGTGLMYIGSLRREREGEDRNEKENATEKTLFSFSSFPSASYQSVSIDT